MFNRGRSGSPSVPRVRPPPLSRWCNVSEEFSLRIDFFYLTAWPWPKGVWVALWERIFSCAVMVLCTFEHVYPVDCFTMDEIALLTANVCAYVLIALICKVIILTQSNLLVLYVCLLFSVHALQGSVKPITTSYPAAYLSLSSYALHPIGKWLCH